jgi:hypothetical protein
VVQVVVGVSGEECSVFGTLLKNRHPRRINKCTANFKPKNLCKNCSMAKLIHREIIQEFLARGLQAKNIKRRKFSAWGCNMGQLSDLYRYIKCEFEVSTGEVFPLDMADVMEFWSKHPYVGVKNV